MPCRLVRHYGLALPPPQIINLNGVFALLFSWLLLNGKVTLPLAGGSALSLLGAYVST